MTDNNKLWLLHIMSPHPEIDKDLLIRAWAETRTDLEIELGYPRDKRDQRINELIAQRNKELAEKSLEKEIAPDAFQPHEDADKPE